MIKNFEKEIDEVLKNPNREAEQMAINMKNNNLLEDYINYYFMSNKDEYLWNIR